jgi:hypothetical protein
VRLAAGAFLAALDGALRGSLRRNLHALASMALILGLFAGTTGLAAFLSVRVAQEGRATLLAARDAFPAAWAGMAASTPLLADVAAAEPAHGGDGGGGGLREGAGGGGGGVAKRGGGGGGGGGAGLPSWVGAYRGEALALVQQSLPALAAWAEAQFYGALERQNLTSAVG